MIDFYILETTHKQPCYRFACALIEKAYAEKKTIHLHTASLEEANQWDALLWTYQDDSFLPHQLHTENPCPITIGYTDTPSPQGDILFNFHPHLPPFYAQFSQVIEIVFADPVVRQWGRMRYKQYRDANHKINTHTLNANELLIS